VAAAVTVMTDAMPAACFAPPMTEGLLARYREMADALPDTRGEVRDAMRELLACVEAWWGLPESSGSLTDPHLEIRHRGKEVAVRLVSLTPDLKRRLDDAVPWPYELRSMEELFGRIDPVADKPLRDAAFHLLWFARELDLGREPLTQDRLGGA
jgi:hypothetical protein